jgi:hypothetical protein
VRCLFAALSLQKYAHCSQREEMKIFYNTTLEFVPISSIFLSDKIKNDWVCRFCDTDGRKEKLVHLLRVADCKRPTGEYRLT